MSPLQKDAVFGITISIIATGLFVTLLVVKNFQVAYAAFGVLGIYGLTPWLFFRKSGKKLLLDERDKEINARGTSIGFWTFWFLFTIVSVITALVGGEKNIPASSLAYAVMVGMIIMIITKSITVLSLYRQGR
jgi:hypothetical protein